jgi:two-component system, NtrC family, response regulator HydG
MGSSSAPTTSARVLIVDDDPEWREALRLVFSADDAACELAASAPDALELLAQGDFDALVCDVRMEGMDGLELLDRVKKMKPALPVVMITGVGRVADAVSAIKRGAFEYVTKPCDTNELRMLVAGAIGDMRRRASEASTRPTRPPPSRARSGELVGAGSAMRALTASIERVATSSAPVLISGETGVGKELVARAIHARGDRRDRPFVAVNTSAVNDDLFESEVFGHVRGAFTGAAQTRKGLLTEADGGTLLLDEIGDMPMNMQAKLLRVLQFGEVRPVGSDRVHFVDVRIIAATHRDLLALVREGRFREDLYFRLNVLPLVVPPLRERREDIPMLAAHFLEEARQRASLSPVRSISEEALRTLASAPWPGNVRELASTIERAVVFSNDETLDLQHVSALPTTDASVPWWVPPSHEPPRTLKRLNHAYVQWVLGQTAGDKHRCAEILGIDLSTLYRWQRAQHDGRMPSDPPPAG